MPAVSAGEPHRPIRRLPGSFVSLEADLRETLSFGLWQRSEGCRDELSKKNETADCDKRHASEAFCVFSN
jgi:hypothetical protein